ncbi:MAG: hypothetical protein V3R84_01675 [Acidimicrobiia bacterium]
MNDRVRPLDVDPQPPRRGLFLATAAAAALGAFGLFLASGTLSPSTPTTTADLPTTTTTLPPTVEVAGSAEELRRLVPGFQGRVRAIGLTGDGAAVGWSWSSGDSEPRLSALPDGAFGSWNGDSALIAAIGASSFGASLYFGPPTNVREVFNDVESFAWHSTEPGALALVTAPQSDGLRELWRSIPDGATTTNGTFNSSRILRFDFDGSLAAYGDWGFALETLSPSGGRQLTTLNVEGNLIAEGPFVYVDDFGDGRLLVATLGDGSLAIVGPDLEAAEPTGPDGVFGLRGSRLEPASQAVLSPNKRWVATVTFPPGGTTLWLTSVDGSNAEEITLGGDLVRPVDWSSDGRWILLKADSGQEMGTRLIFFDTGSAAVHTVETVNDVSGLSIHSTGVPGPATFFVPGA